MLPIIMAIENDDDRAFVDNLYNTYEKQMYLIANEILKNHHDAQDCVHETVRSIINSLERFRYADDHHYLERLVVVACRNNAINMYNKRHKIRTHEVSTTSIQEESERETWDIPDHTQNVEDLYVSEENCNRIRAIIDSMDKEYRDVVILRSYGMDYEKIASAMKITAEAARQRMRRARQKILEEGGDSLYVGK
jgi:RNA polymerase sigma-70 factor (ECF subfamily)